MNIFRGSNGKRILHFINEELPQIKAWDVFLIGENHMDPQRLSLQQRILEKVSCPELTLSLEFWDRSSQPVIHEYLSNLIDEDIFLRDSNPPENYTDYMGLIRHCKDKKLNVLGANCPRRYVSIVRRLGRSGLELCSDSGKTFLPSPLTYAPPSEAYSEVFKEMMGVVGRETMDSNSMMGMLEAQNLWDATMAHSICEQFKQNKKVIHLTGHFHIQKNLGLVEHLKKYAPDAKIVSMVIIPEENPSIFDNEKHKDLADYVVLTK
ncbi:uncharacterized protein [Lepeophtheirus salmonis]|uniref:Haem-binding uptake Tiki superfamily ChaN domain-containing protein n=1 Tax=Lepeophtheirus salmonis TaxID=72036 RepID=A0A0K2T431_LEPSM